VRRALGTPEEVVRRATEALRHAVAEWDEEQLAQLFLPPHEK
jgi:hypothetical protein